MGELEGDKGFGLGWGRQCFVWDNGTMLGVGMRRAGLVHC